jgi:hypothetical protein
MVKTLIVPLLSLAFAACFIACGEVSVDHPATLQVQAASPSPTPEYVPSNEDLTEWYDKSTDTLFKGWLAGEDLDGQFVDLDWSDEAKKWISLGDATAKVALWDVDGDGRKEMAYQTACAPVGNCNLFIHQRADVGHRRILAASMVQTFKLRKSKTKGYYDLETSAHGDAISGGIAVYKYNGEVYKISECFGYEYKVIGTKANGQSIVSKKPTLTPANCDKWPGEPERWF